MKNSFFALLALSACMVIAPAQTKSEPKAPSASSAIADELKQMENDWLAALKNRDDSKLGEILADSWVGQGWDGQVSDKKKALADLKAPANSLDTFEMGPIRVRVFGNTAVVTGSDVEKSAYKGKDTSGKYIWTDVFVKQDGKWRAVASHVTKAPK